MMKRFSFLLSVFCLCMTLANAKPIGKSQALSRAKVFLAKKGMSFGIANDVHKAPRTSSEVDDDAYYYVFNLKGDNGFVIVSGDDRTAPILGYSDRGHFDEMEIPCNMKAWLQGYVDEMIVLKEGRLPGSLTNKPQAHMAEAVKRPIAPLLTTLWDQGTPYNNSCPTYNGQKCLTGCTATAMAQLMYFYREGSVTTVQKQIPSYTTDMHGFNVPAIPTGSAIDWDNMLASYSGSESNAQNLAVANLMTYCGRSVYMDYAPDASGASVSYIPSALTNYFGYAEGGSNKNRGDYSIKEWQDMIFNELSNRHPVLYSGTSSGGGHAFVVDGFDGENLFHINWGWSGMSDGYFLLTVANPGNNSGAGASTSSDGYSMWQTALIGVRLTSDGTQKPITMTTGFTSVSGNDISAFFRNDNEGDVAFIGGIGYVDENGDMQYLTQSPWKLDLSTGWHYNLDYTINANTFKAANLPNGTYILKPICMMNDDTEWIATNHDAMDYVIAVYDGTTVTLTLHERNISLAATSFEYPGDLAANNQQPVKVSVKNNGDEFYGFLYLFASKTSDKGNYQDGVINTIEAGKTAVPQFTFTPTETGKYNIWIATDEAGNNVIGQDQVTISTAIASSYNLTTQGITLECADREDVATYGATIYGTRFKGVLTLKNEASSTFSGDIIVYLFKYNPSDGYYYGSDNMRTNIIVSANNTIDIPFEFGGQEYTEYLIVAYYDDDDWTSIGQYPRYNSYTLAPGVELFYADGSQTATAATGAINIPDDVVAVNISGVATDVNSITPNGNPNTLYYIGGNETAPSGTPGNIIKGLYANNITLVEGHDFYVPMTFTANNISYTMTPERGSNGSGGWNTLVLPFDVQTVKTDSKTIDWFHSKNDTNKNFWLRQFIELDDDNSVVFGDVEQIEANIPYIIAFPTDKWGEEYNLVGKGISFLGTNATITADTKMLVSTSLYNFEGTTRSMSVSNVYALDDAGAVFKRGNATIHPFHAYFKPKAITSAQPAYIKIKFTDEDGTNGIMTPFAQDGETIDVYNPSGTKVGTVKATNGSISLEGLPKGVYIIKGKKIIK